MQRRLPVFALIAIVALVAVSGGLATAVVVQSHGYLLDPDGRAHVQALTGLNYGIVTEMPSTPQPTRSTPQPMPTPKPKPSPVPCTNTDTRGCGAIIAAAFCNGQSVQCERGKQAEGVAMCMSGEMPGNTNAAGGMGLFGIRAQTWAMSPEHTLSPFDPAANAKAAAWLYQQSGWTRWGSCAPPTAFHPTFTPVSGTSVQALIVSVFGMYAASALAIARCESGYNPTAYNPVSVDGSHAEGVFQILYPSTWNNTDYKNSSPYDAKANIEAAYMIFMQDGYNWHEWQCQP